MNLFLIAWRSIQQRGLASVLTALSMALGVLLVVTVLAIHGVVSESFNSSSLGYNLIVGAKGGKLQLTLNTVYYLSQPVENIPYEYYLEFTPAAQRAAALEHSIRSHVTQSEWDTLGSNTNLSGGLDGLGRLAEAAAHVALQQAAVERLDHDRAGRFSSFTGFVIPVCLGDYFGQFRVVGTTPEMFDKLSYGPRADKHYEFARGRNFQTWNAEHGYFEAVVGATVAREMQVDVGDEISPSHSGPDGDEHASKFTVVGVLKPSGTPNDRAVFINMEGFYLMEDHAKPLPEPEETAEESGVAAEGSGAEASAVHTHVAEELEPLPIEQREVTALLVRTANEIVGVRLPTIINEGRDAQCVLPILEIANLFDFIVAPIQKALLGITALVCLVSGISILVSIYNSMSDRRHEIAVMRALGASRGTVMTIILLESILLSVGGGAVGWLSAHAVIAIPQVSGYVEEQTGVPLGFTSFAPPIDNLATPVIGPIMGLVSPELLLVPALLLLAVIVGFIPAMAAYRTDVAKSLGS